MLKLRGKTISVIAASLKLKNMFFIGKVGSIL